MYMGVASLAKMAMAFLPKTIWLCDVKMAYKYTKNNNHCQPATLNTLSSNSTGG